MSNAHYVVLLVTAWIALWTTEVILAKLFLGEEVPFWMYGVQSIFVTAIMVRYLKW